MKDIYIIRRYRQFLKQQVEAEKKIDELQQRCPHRSIQKTHRGDTGNYDRSQDRYWTEMKCQVCQSFWTVEGSV